MSIKRLSFASMLFLPVSAFAAVPEAVTTALSDGKTDALAVASAALIIIIAVAVFKYMRRGV